MTSRQPFPSPERIPPPKVRLLKFTTVFAIGGTERQVVNLVRGLDGEKFDLHLACFHRSGQLLPEIESLGIPISEYPIHRLCDPRTVLQQLRLARFLRRQRIHVIHAYGFYASAFALPAAKLARVPILVASIRDTGEMLTSRQKQAQQWICRLADSVLVNAEAVRQWLIAGGFPPETISLIHNGIELRRFDPGPSGPSVRQQWGIAPDVPVIAMISRLNRLKGAEYFLSAAVSIASRFPAARFLIVGDVWAGDLAYRRELEERIVQLGLQDRVLFSGFRTDVPRILSEVTVSVLPSLSEGLSNTLLESMAAGVPVVATRVGGNPEIVQDGVTGLLVPPGDAASLAQAISRLLEAPPLAMRLGEAGKRRIAECFCTERMVRETEDHYCRLLETRSPSRRNSFQPVVN